jgi:gamma-glutamyl hercynylcysteine S-oxide hydrolase
MCRIAGFIGPDAPLSTLVSAPPHSLRKQAHSPRELTPGMIGSDGYGIAWLANDDRIARYRQILPIWADANLQEMAPHIRSRCFVASTRTATDDMPVSLTNTPPFCAGDIMLVHNGSISEFHTKVAQSLWLERSEPGRRRIQGNSDTEYITAMLADTPHGPLDVRVRSVLRRLTEHVKTAGTKAALNLIAADAERLVAVRYAVADENPSLYYAREERSGSWFASEPLDDRTWTRLPTNTLICVTREHGTLEAASLDP